MLSGRLADKMVFVAIYTVVAVLVVIQAGRHMTNYVLDTVFYNDYLMPWNIQLTALRHLSIQWPAYHRHDPGGYMERIAAILRVNGLAPPRSNTDRSYVYRLNKFGDDARHILVVATAGLMTLYNLPVTTFDRLDRIVDGRCDAAQGRWTGRWSADGVSRIAYWRI